MKNHPLISSEKITTEIVLDEIRTTFKKSYHQDNIEFLENVINDIIDLFLGKRHGFLKCDTSYHDLSHTLQVVFVFLKIVRGWNQKEHSSKISQEMFQIGIIAAFLHDVGYIKTVGDNHGTGGKYTFIHIQRGIDFARDYLSQKGFHENQIQSVKNILTCTGLKIDYDSFPFYSKEERIISYAVGTADLIAQMADNDYIEKLPLLFHEFKEAYHFEGVEKLKKTGALLYESPRDLMEKTPYFYEKYVKERLKKMQSMHEYLAKDSKNLYIEAIEKNIEKIKLATKP